MRSKRIGNLLEANKILTEHETFEEFSTQMASQRNWNWATFFSDKTNSLSRALPAKSDGWTVRSDGKFLTAAMWCAGRKKKRLGGRRSIESRRCRWKCKSLHTCCASRNVFTCPKICLPQPNFHLGNIWKQFSKKKMIVFWPPVWPVKFPVGRSHFDCLMQVQLWNLEKPSLCHLESFICWR